MAKQDLYQLLSENEYPGRGIMLGRTEDGKKAVAVYFIMGRSANSRNRIFVSDGEGIRTQAYDYSKMEDPSLIIYAPVRTYENCTIVTNGDQTDTIVNGFAEGLTFSQSLNSREFEPDAPNYTPRISGILYRADGELDISLSILKSNDGDPSNCLRYTYTYENAPAGEGRFISTYEGNGNPLPSFSGDPVRVAVEGGIEEIAEKVWENLNEENKVSLFVRTIDLASGDTETVIINKNER